MDYQVSSHFITWLQVSSDKGGSCLRSLKVCNAGSVSGHYYTEQLWKLNWQCFMARDVQRHVLHRNKPYWGRNQ